MALKAGINGFGRIGRNVFRAAHARGADIDWVGVNDLTDPKTLAHLLKYDSILGPFEGEIDHTDDSIVVDGDELKVFAERDPGALPWGDVGAEVVIESTGFFTKRDDAAKHLEAGAKKVIISAPATEPDVTLVLGRERRRVRPGQPPRHLERVLHDQLPRPGGARAARRRRDRARDHDHDPRLHRGPEPPGRAAQGPPPRACRRGEPGAHLDRRREGDRPGGAGARRKAERRSPCARRSSPARWWTSSARCRAPTSVDEINSAFAEKADSGAMEGILRYSDEPIVSTDIARSPYSSIFDAPLTMVIDEKLVKVVSWYDNEWGYSNRVVDLAQRVLAGSPVA